MGFRDPRRLSDYDVVVFDCDGVLIDSNSAKTKAFEEVAVEFGFAPQNAARFSSWQSRNFGISRYRVLEELLAGRFGPSQLDPSALRLPDLTRAFANRVKLIYETAPETFGARSLLERHSNQRLYVASGSDQTELREALEQRRLSNYFVQVCGSPTPKGQLVADIVMREREHLGRAPRGVMLGDAESDADAAARSGIDFIFISAYSSVRHSMLKRCQSEDLPYVETLADLLEETEPAN